MADGKKAAKALKDADKRHYNQVEKYVKVVDGLYTQAVDHLSALAVRIGLPEDDSTFEFPKSKQNEVQKVVKQLADRITATIMVGDRNEWNAACTKFDDFVETVLNTSKLTRKQLAKYEARNLEALSAFQQRKVDGLDLSERVWKTVQPFKDEVELAIDTATGEGKSAAELSRDVRSCLKDPDKLFRRVRDKYGNLHLSKAAKLYHPGQGVYRSSYKNAMRVTRSEINMAYRQSDHMRWQQLDFVVGIQVQTSNNHTCLGADGKPHRFTDICDELAGKYPKDFKFVGWHPQCRCFATPILKTLDEVEEEIDEDGNYRDLPSANEVKDVPDNFKQYIADNAARIEEWKSMPYYIKDNPQYIDEILHPEKYVVKAAEAVLTREQKIEQAAQKRHAARTKEQEEAIRKFADDHKKKTDALYDEIKATIKAVDGIASVDASKLRNLIMGKEGVTTMKGGEKALASIEKLKKELSNVKNELAKVNDPLKEFNARVANNGILYNEVKMFDKTPPEEDIIKRLAGGDMTKGSCSSLAFAYAGNKAGMDVLDFRGGGSCYMFSNSSNIFEIVEKSGGIIAKNSNDFTKAEELLKNVVVGKEYYFTCARHAAIVRKTASGFEYLELQSRIQNGWKHLDKSELRRRFKGQNSHSTYGVKYETRDCIIDIELLAKNPGFKRMLGYINTNQNYQMKGAAGSIK